ncbi:hypothetical protein C8R44DRAFT_957787 [Mycena epipterygia]|nr:hypothetical protein C8R44DRAFT_957787 [Mycena epipterygia]
MAPILKILGLVWTLTTSTADLTAIVAWRWRAAKTARDNGTATDGGDTTFHYYYDIASGPAPKRLGGLAVLDSGEARIATSAACGSLNDPIKLQHITCASPAPSEGYLPVFFANLDPDDIPDDAQVANVALSDTERDSIRRAWVVLLMIYSVGEVPSGAFSRFWPRYWQHRDVLVWMDVDGLSENLLCLDLLAFLSRFRQSAQAVQIMLATPGFRYMITRSWFFHFQLGDANLELGYRILNSILLQNTKDLTPAAIQELIDGAGGTYSRLASLVVRYIHGVLPDMKELPSPDAVILLSNIANFVTNVDDGIQGRGPSPDGSLGAFGVSLLHEGLVPALTNVTYALSHEGSSTGSVHLLDQYLALLIRLLADPRGYLFIGEALDAGLLYAIALCDARGVMEHHSLRILADILPAALVSYYNVAASGDAFAELKSNSFIVDSDASEQLTQFADIVSERGLVLNSFLATGSPSLRACDNVQCGKIREKTALKRCVACQSFYYCDRKCQKVDWRMGGHRAACSPGTSAHLGVSATHNLEVRERLFLRALVTHDYLAVRWTDLYPQKVAFMATHPGAPYFTLFDYRRGRVEITVQAVAGSAVSEYFDASSARREWRNDVARASRSGGCLELDVVAVAEGARTRYLVVPLRTNDAYTHDALVQLAKFSPRAKDIPELVRGVKLSGAFEEQTKMALTAGKRKEIGKKLDYQREKLSTSGPNTNKALPPILPRLNASRGQRAVAYAAAATTQPPTAPEMVWGSILCVLEVHIEIQ